MTASSLAFDVVDIDVDVDLALDAAGATDFPFPEVPPRSTLGVVDAGAPILMPPTPQVIQTYVQLDSPVLMEPAPQVIQTYVQLDPPVLVDPVPPQVTQMVIDAV
ncbi:hypothetical protein [Kitasatospora sp. SUK 42]|uniref:hypothetical protein n=1 Tax=Kitasatospora sp. SUK 42 TaxID=1588882 RepID=UPI0018CA7147|nr:hypothetical protein [Kitasatospora sp. SUK 42]MBV2153350.1 hypothetical protein [Kitasatospora sp. SUK 42]